MIITEMTKRLIFIFLLTTVFTCSFSQMLSSTRFWVPFTDKPGNEYTISHPEDFLSERSLQRRARQGINIIPEDLPVHKAYLDSLENLGLLVIGASKWFNAAIVETSDTLLLESLNGISFIRDFEYSVPLKKSNLFSAEIGEQKYSSFISKASSADYGIAGKQINMLNGKALHEMDYRGKGIILAVFDAGFYHADIYPAFDSLWQNGRILAWKDIAEPGKSSFFSGDSHGMSVLSTMGANIPGTMVGTAPEASYVLLRSEVSGSETLSEEAYWLLAAEFADSIGADIINSSLGYATFDDSSMNYSFKDMDGITTISTIAAEKAISKGMIVVASAGNEGNKTWKKIIAPSDGINVVAVGAIDTLGFPAPFTSLGPSSDLRVKPDVSAVGLRAGIITSTGIPGYGNGTSFSSPQVAGLIACLWQALPDKTNLEIIDAVRRASSQYYFPDHALGYGIPDFLLALNQMKSFPEVEPGYEILIIPNPNIGIFEIRMKNPDEEVKKIYIYDSMGRKIASFENPESRYGYIMIDLLGHISPGLYFIMVRTENNDYTAKMIKQE